MYTLYDADGVAVAGETIISGFMRDRCDEINGHITDPTGQVVYPIKED